jgi:hypothetical protein
MLTPCRTHRCSAVSSPSAARAPFFSRRLLNTWAGRRSCARSLARSSPWPASPPGASPSCSWPPDSVGDAPPRPPTRQACKPPKVARAEADSPARRCPARRALFDRTSSSMARRAWREGRSGSGVGRGPRVRVPAGAPSWRAVVAVRAEGSASEPPTIQLVRAPAPLGDGGPELAEPGASYGDRRAMRARPRGPARAVPALRPTPTGPASQRQSVFSKTRASMNRSRRWPSSAPERCSARSVSSASSARIAFL